MARERFSSTSSIHKVSQIFVLAEVFLYHLYTVKDLKKMEVFKTISQHMTNLYIAISQRDDIVFNYQNDKRNYEQSIVKLIFTTVRVKVLPLFSFTFSNTALISCIGHLRERN